VVTPLQRAARELRASLPLLAPEIVARADALAAVLGEAPQQITASEVARRIGRPAAEVATALEALATAGLLERSPGWAGTVFYSAGRGLRDRVLVEGARVVLVGGGEGEGGEEGA